MKLCEKIENINREYCNFFYYEGWADEYDLCSLSCYEEAKRLVFKYIGVKKMFK